MYNVIWLALVVSAVCAAPNASPKYNGYDLVELVSEQRMGMCSMMNGGSWLDPNYWAKFYAGMMWQMMPQDYSGLPTTPPELLPRLNIDKSKIAVAGLSSGAFMAVQMHVAYSATFTAGVGSFAGGPFYCAEGSIGNAFPRCMCGSTYMPLDHLIQLTRDWAAQKHVDPVENLAKTRVYINHGTDDGTVVPAIADSLYQYYRAFIPESQIKLDKSVHAEHAFVTDGPRGAPCNVNAKPWVISCYYDSAKQLFQQMYGELKPKSSVLGQRIRNFNQNQFIQGHGMADEGYFYVPSSCQSGAKCKLLVAFHGCQQNAGLTGAAFPLWTGLNEWADTNDIVILYPQTGWLATNGCWDWWGYDSPYYSSKTGPQMAAVKAMVDHITSGSREAQEQIFRE